MKKYEYELLNEDVNDVLNQLLNEYKELLITNIIEEKQYRNLKDINIRDIIEEDNRVKNIMTEKKIQKRRKKLISIIISMGMVYSIIGITILMYTSKEFSSDVNSKLAIMMTSLGLIISAIASLFKELPIKAFKEGKVYEEKSKEITNGLELIKRWNDIEGLLYNINKHDLIENAYVPIGRLISNAVNENIINEEDRRKIKGILMTRNSLVHYTESEISSDEMRQILEDADYIVRKLKKY